METQEYKTRIEKMLEEITKELKAIGIHNPENPDDWIAVPENLNGKEADLNDAADKVEEWNERRALVATLETRYNNIKIALLKIENDSFGTCEVCDKQIEEQRLDANPVSRTCIGHIEETLK